MPEKKRPVGVTIIGVCNLILGGLGVLGGLCFGAMVIGGGILMNVKPPKADPQVEISQWLLRATVEGIPGAAAYFVVFVLVWLVTSGFFFISGMGMLGLRGWAWRLCLFSVLLNLLFQAGSFVYIVTVYNPALIPIQREFAQRAKKLPPQKRPFFAVEPDEAALPLMHVQQGCYSSLCSLYSFLLLFVLFTPVFRRAFTSNGASDDWAYRTSSRDGDDYYYDNR